MLTEYTAYFTQSYKETFPCSHKPFHIFYINVVLETLKAVRKFECIRNKDH